jgi:enamine deaminase RidA (YjgF/YER057c/UK114 family)
VERRLIPGHSPYEAVVGFSRAVVAGDRVHVAGTAPIPVEGDPPEGAYDQTRLCLEIIGGALERAGATFADVVRTRTYLTEAEDWPASTCVVVKALVDPRFRVEIEAEAVLSP